MNRTYSPVITTRYRGPTNNRGSRIIATAFHFKSNDRFPSVTVPYDCALNATDNHQLAALALIAHIGSDAPETLIHGDGPDGCVVWMDGGRHV